MPSGSLDDSGKLIKELIKQQEMLAGNLEKINALMYVALDENFLINPLHHYLFSISDMVESTLCINEGIINNLIRNN